MGLYLRFALLFSMVGLFASCGGRGRKVKDTGARQDSIAVANAVAEKPIVNVYVENSGSMNGYVHGATDFEHAVYGYLSDVKSAGLADSINLNYINSEIIPQGSDIKDFIDKLAPSTFAASSGNHAVSDIANVLDSILTKTTDNSVSIFISDCVFSPGSGKEASEYLVNQQIGIKADVANHLKAHPQTAFLIYRLTSEFVGTYYNCYDAPTTINDRRPFFIWLIGDVQHILALQKKIPNSAFKGSGVTDSYALLPQTSNVEYYIPLSPRLGDFKQKVSRNLTKVKREKKGMHKGQFMFTVEANLGELQALVDNNYLCDPANWLMTMNGRPSDLFSVDITTKPPTAKNRYTHRLQIATDGVIENGELEIALKNQAPAWIEDKNDIEGFNIRAVGAMDKTFGIRNLIGGVEEAYQIVAEAPADTEQIYCKITVNLTK